MSARFKRGDVVRVKPALGGQLGAIIRVSKRTGWYTLKLLDGRTKGTEIQIAPYDCVTNMQTRGVVAGGRKQPNPPPPGAQKPPPPPNPPKV